MRTHAAIGCEKKAQGLAAAKEKVMIEKANPRWLDLSADGDQPPKIDDGCANAEEMIS